MRSQGPWCRRPGYQAADGTLGNILARKNEALDRMHPTSLFPGAAALLIALTSGVAAAQEAAPSRESQFLSNIQQLTSGFVKAGEGYFSPDARLIVFQAQPLDYPFYQIFVQPLAGGPPRRISTGRGRTTCSFFSPDGARILFASSHLDPHLDQTEAAERRKQEEDRRSGVRRRYQWDFDPYMDLFEADLEGHIVRRLTDTPGYDAEGAYSPDGTQIAFCSDRDGDPDIYLMRSDGTNVRQLTNAPGYDGGPFISPDQRWIVFRSDRKRPEWLQLYVIGLDGQHETQLTDTQGVNWGPYWHPTKPYLIWSAADHSNPAVRPNYDLWMARYTVTDGRFTLGPPIRVTDHPAADVLPVFSPDGRRLMWTSTRTADHSSQLFLADFRLPEEEAPRP
jgi:Tol biopolymer transport system component